MNFYTNEKILKLSVYRILETIICPIPHQFQKYKATEYVYYIRCCNTIKEKLYLSIGNLCSLQFSIGTYLFM